MHIYLYSRLLTFKERNNSTMHGSDIETQLSFLEKELLKQHELCIVRGKRGSRVPVLLPRCVLPAMIYIADEQVRSSVGLNTNTDDEGRQFLFSNRGIFFAYIRPVVLYSGLHNFLVQILCTCRL